MSTASLRHNPDHTKGEVLLLLLTCLIGLSLIYLADAAAQAGSAERGQGIFQAKCASCHTIGGGDLVGPDLKGVTEQRDPEWLSRWILEPDKVIAEGDPIARQLLERYSSIPMPNQGLSQQDTEDVIAYIAAQSGGAPEKPPEKLPEGPGVPSGNSSAGESLFLGRIQLENGGPPCQACHNVAGGSALGGGLLGPDLTGVHSRYGDTGLSSVLASLPFPTMTPVYGDRPLTPQEQADLKAFFTTVADLPVKQDAMPPAYLALVGFAATILLLQILWRRRLIGVRRPMVEKAVTEEAV